MTRGTVVAECLRASQAAAVPPGFLFSIIFQQESWIAVPPRHIPGSSATALPTFIILKPLFLHRQPFSFTCCGFLYLH